MIYQVEGQIDLTIDDSSSSDDEDNKSNNDIKYIPPHNNHNSYIEDEDDNDEVEYFGDKPSLHNCNDSTTTTRKLATTQQTKQEEPKKHLASFLNSTDNAQDEFGITYKMYRPLLDITNSNNNYMLNVTDEYSEEISARFLNSHNIKKSQLYNTSIQETTITEDNNDDEFDIIINDESNLSDESNLDNSIIINRKIENELAIKQALELAATSYNIQDAIDDSHFVLEESMDISLPMQDIPIASSTFNKSSEDTPSTVKDEKLSILEEARKAFREISEVYSNGLGDQEILLLSSHNSPTTTDATIIPTANSNQTLSSNCDLMRGIHITIEEGDEDAVDEEEEYLNMKEKEEIEKYIQEQMALESEWNDITLDVPSKEEHCLIASFATSNEEVHVLPTTAASSITNISPISNNSDNPLLPVLTPASPLITTYSTALEYFQSLDLSIHLTNICTTEPNAKSSWFTSSVGIKYPGSNIDLALPFLIAQVDYDYSNMQHRFMLSTIYHTLMNNQNNNNNNNDYNNNNNNNNNNNTNNNNNNINYNSIANIGNHWENIGFQGMDPCTDLNRSMKMLSILQVLFLIQNDLAMIQHAFYTSQSNHTTSISTSTSPALTIKERNLLSKDDTSWPFMCVSIMFTKESIQVLRKGFLNEKCNKKQNVFDVLNEFYKACFLEFISLLEEKPLIHHAIHLSSIRKQCESMSSALKLLKKYKYQAKSIIFEKDSEQSRNTSQLHSNKTATVKNNIYSSIDNINTNNYTTLEKELKFDDLDKLEENNMNKPSQDTVAGSTNSSSWFNMFESDRSTRFRISDTNN